MRCLFVIGLAVGLTGSWACVASAQEDASSILRAADRARGNLDGIKWKVTLTTVDGGRTNAMAFAVQARGFDILAETIAPARNRGNRILMLKGNMWFHKPDLSKPVPVSQRQRLLGTAAYGDIAATDYANDYDPKPLPDEVINGEDCRVFDLTARSKKTTYDRIVYWISKKRLVGVRAVYYTVSGKKFKSAEMEYENAARIGGEVRPFVSRMVIRDLLMGTDTTTLLFSTPDVADVPNSVFDLNLLAR